VCRMRRSPARRSSPAVSDALNNTRMQNLTRGLN